MVSHFISFHSLYRFCPTCKDHVCAENATFIDKLPDVLVIQLERFEYCQGYGSFSSRRKLSTFINFPIHDLNMKEWIYSKDMIKEEDCIYDLRAICNHAGSSSGGHYYCYACDENDGSEVWNEYNDSSVYPIQENNLIRESAYVLFYQRRSSSLSTKQMIESFESKWISNPTMTSSPVSSYSPSSYWNSTSKYSPTSAHISSYHWKSFSKHSPSSSDSSIDSTNTDNINGDNIDTFNINSNNNVDIINTNNINTNIINVDNNNNNNNMNVDNNMSVDNDDYINIDNNVVNNNDHNNFTILENRSDPITVFTKEDEMKNELDKDDKNPSDKQIITNYSKSDDNIDNLYNSFVCLSFFCFYACIF